MALAVQEPIQAAKSVARRSAKRAAKQAAAASGHLARKKSRGAARRAVRIGGGALAAGIIVALVVVAIRQLRAAPAPELDQRADFDEARRVAGSEGGRSSTGGAQAKVASGD